MGKQEFEVIIEMPNDLLIYEPWLQDKIFTFINHEILDVEVEGDLSVKVRELA